MVDLDAPSHRLELVPLLDIDLQVIRRQVLELSVFLPDRPEHPDRTAVLELYDLALFGYPDVADGLEVGLIGLATAVSSPSLVPLLAESTSDSSRTGVLALQEGMMILGLSIESFLSFLPETIA